ncbi:hypothetical protein [Coraliomargarita parva]|uniref:hypothetical protein n=1 Tax=Coraliomargarita parva TaxID=3014050 RepID=UPI0022B4A2D3|nr:hypothetical protein [Coraliomargarita parva]
MNANGQIRKTRDVYRQQSASGFALVVALSLMAFIILLILSLTSLVSVETANGQHQMLMLQARQNALLGLNVAIGEVQESMGPDKRVSGTAALLDTDPYDEDLRDATSGLMSIDGLRDACVHWTGVWETSRDNDDYVQVVFRKWLVSGTIGNSDPNRDSVLSDASSMDNAITFVSGSDEMEAGKVDIAASSGPSDGAYAWWVGDEGVKAKANLTNPTADDDGLSPLRYGIEQVNNLEWYAGSLPLASNMVDFPSLEIVAKEQGGTEDAISEVHDALTFSSYGVLSNTIADSDESALRKDLTLGLYDATMNPNGQMFGAASSTGPSVLDPGGPYWDQLRSWVNLQPNGDGELPVQEATATKAGAYPILAGCELYVVPTYQRDGSFYSIYYNFFPAVILWNPYNVPLKSQDYVVSLGHVRLNKGAVDQDFVNIWNYDWVYFAYADRTAPNTRIIYSLPGSTFNHAIQFVLNSGVINPGEAIVYSPVSGGGIVNYDVSDPLNGTNSPVLERGFRIGADGFRFNTGLSLDATSTQFTSDDGVVEIKGSVSGHATRVLATRLALADGSVLQSSVYQDTNNPNGIISINNANYIEESPSNGSALDLSQALGIQLIMNYTDNDRFWNAYSNVVFPESKKWLSLYNPRARLHGPTPLVFDDQQQGMVSCVPTYSCSRLIDGETNASTGFADISGGNVDVGAVGNSRCILFQVAPDRDDLRSIGQLSQAPLYNDSGDFEERVVNSRFGNLIPAYAVGNGRADPLIDLEELSRNWGEVCNPLDATFDLFVGVHHDYAYKLNEALWDQWFFSTLPDSTSWTAPENLRLAVLDSDSADAPSVDAASANLMLDGAFNINSTSVEAWKALLASFYGTDVTREDGTVDSSSAATPRSPLLRLDEPYGGPVEDGASEIDEENYTGYRRLDRDQIAELARYIVEEVKLRGPFGSLAQFVNRMPNRDGRLNEDPDAFRLKGALAAAINKTDINEVLKTTDFEVDPSGTSQLEVDAEAGWRSEDLPGWLSQVDILSRLGSVLSARSDTFRIQAYGEATNPLTGQKAIARGEAIVQRLPEFVESMDAPELSFDELGAVNQQMGRRFVVVGFRWLEGDN